MAKKISPAHQALKNIIANLQAGGVEFEPETDFSTIGLGYERKAKPSPEVRQAKASERIAAREAQVKRLERKVKALTTRLKRARRSLAALKRHHPEAK